MAKKRKNTGKKSRGKGRRGEYKIRDALQEWWGSEFHRTPGSGAFATRTSADYNVCGDVSTPDDSFPFCVEMKNCEGWNLEQLLTAPRCDLYAWWDQTVEQCPGDLLPLLIFTRNYQPLYYMMYSPEEEASPLAMARKTFEFTMEDGVCVQIGLFEDFTRITTKEDWL